MTIYSSSTGHNTEYPRYRYTVSGAYPNLPATAGWGPQWVENTSSTGVAGWPVANWWNRQGDTDWKLKVAKTQDASNYYQVRRCSIVPGVARADVEYINSLYGNIEYGWTRVQSPGILPQHSLDYEDTSLADIALARLKRKMNNRTQSYNVLVPIGELREMRQLIEGAALFSIKTVEALKDLKKLRPKQAWKKASDVWLTYSFGMAPMMGTILDISKSISSYLTRYDSVDRLVGQAKRDWITSEVATNITSCNGTQMRVDGSFKHELSYRYVTGHKFNLASANDYGALDHFGVKPASLVPVIWELTAFSWVVDYFTTAGAFLDDTFTGTTGNSIYIIKNKRYTMQGTTKMSFVQTQASHLYKKFLWRSSPATFNYFLFRREALSALPGRVLRFKTMDEIGMNAVSKLLNLTSVASKSFR